MTLLNSLHSRLLQTWFRLHGAEIGRGCMLERGVAIDTGFRAASKGRI